MEAGCHPGGQEPTAGSAPGVEPTPRRPAAGGGVVHVGKALAGGGGRRRWEGWGDRGLDRRCALPRSQGGETGLQEAVSGREASYPVSGPRARGPRWWAQRCGSAGKPGPGTAWGSVQVGEAPPGWEGCRPQACGQHPWSLPLLPKGEKRKRREVRRPPPLPPSPPGGADVGAGPAEVTVWGVPAAVAGSPAWPTGRALGADVRTRSLRKPTKHLSASEAPAPSTQPPPVLGSCPPRRRRTTAFAVSAGTWPCAWEGGSAGGVVGGRGQSRGDSAPCTLRTVGVSVQTTLSKINDKLRKTEWCPHWPPSRAPGRWPSHLLPVISRTSVSLIPGLAVSQENLLGTRGRQARGFPPQRSPTS